MYNFHLKVKKVNKDIKTNQFTMPIFYFMIKITIIFR